jgi:hypothetical protein
MYNVQCTHYIYHTFLCYDAFSLFELQNYFLVFRRISYLLSFFCISRGSQIKWKYYIFTSNISTFLQINSFLLSGQLSNSHK